MFSTSKRTQNYDWPVLKHLQFRQNSLTPVAIPRGLRVFVDRPQVQMTDPACKANAPLLELFSRCVGPFKGTSVSMDTDAVDETVIHNTVSREIVTLPLQRPT